MGETYNIRLALIVAAVFLILLVIYFPQRRRVLALARLTFLDAVRKKVLAVFLLFAVVVIGVSQFFPVFRAEDRLRVVESVCFWSISTFGMIVAIFVAALSLPSDLTEKTIYTVATKPVRRGTVILGKTLGFAALSAAILLLMGVVSLGVIHVVDRSVRRETRGPSGLFARWSIPPGEQHFEGVGLVRRDGRTLVNGEALSAYVWMFPSPALHVKPGGPAVVGLRGRFEAQAGFSGSTLPLYVEFKRGEKKGMALPVDVPPGQPWQAIIPISSAELDVVGRSSVFEVAIGPRTPFVFQAGIEDLTLFVNDISLPAEKLAPRAEGLAPKRTITWISKLVEHRAVWTFRGLRPSSLPEKEVEGFADLKISPGAFGATRVKLKFAFGDPAVPARYAEQTVVSTRDRVTLFRTPTRCIGPDGVLRIAVEREEKDSYLGIPDHPEIGLYARHGNFDWNFIKALLVILFQLALLSAVAVSGSTFLSAPVSVLFAFFVFFCGNLIDFMRNAASVLSWGTSSHSHTHGQEAGGVLAGLWQWIVDRISDMAGFAMPKVAQIMPNLQQFDVAGNVMSGDEIPFAMIVNAMVYFGAFGLFAVIVGQIVFRKKEIE